MSVSAATERAVRLRGGSEPPRAAPAVAPRRAVAIGDPQTSAERWFGALAAHGLLGDDGWLRPDVRLVAMGDYFDYHVPERDRARVEGVLILGWLATHAPAQVTLLAGNHDLARVMEFAHVDDDRFRAAADAAAAITALPRDRAERGRSLQYYISSSAQWRFADGAVRRRPPGTLLNERPRERFEGPDAVTIPTDEVHGGRGAEGRRRARRAREGETRGSRSGWRHVLERVGGGDAVDSGPPSRRSRTSGCVRK